MRCIAGKIRWDIFNKQNQLNGLFDEDSPTKLVATTLPNFTELIIDSGWKGRNTCYQAALTAAQISTLNWWKRTFTRTRTYCFLKTKTPLMRHVILKIDSAMTTKILIQNFFELPIWVSYIRRLKAISTFTGKYVRLSSPIKSSSRKIWIWRCLRFWQKITSTWLRRQSLLNHTTTGPLICSSIFCIIIQHC